MSKEELLQRLHALTTDFHTLACDMDIGNERTEIFEIYGVLHNLGRRGYACQVGRRMNPLLDSCDDDEDEEDDDWDEDDD